MQFSLTYLSPYLFTEQQVILDTVKTDENTLPLILSCFYPLLCSFGKLKDFVGCKDLKVRI